MPVEDAAASSDALEAWLEQHSGQGWEDAGGPGEGAGSWHNSSDGPVGPGPQSALSQVHAEEEALMLLALEQLEDGKPGGLGEPAGRVGGVQQGGVQQGPIDEDELLMLEALEQLEMYEQQAPRSSAKRQPPRQQVEGRQRQKKGKGRRVQKGHTS